MCSNIYINSRARHRSRLYRRPYRTEIRMAEFAEKSASYSGRCSSGNGSRHLTDVTSTRFSRSIWRANRCRSQLQPLQSAQASSSDRRTAAVSGARHPHQAPSQGSPTATNSGLHWSSYFHKGSNTSVSPSSIAFRRDEGAPGTRNGRCHISIRGDSWEQRNINPERQSPTVQTEKAAQCAATATLIARPAPGGEPWRDSDLGRCFVR